MSDFLYASLFAGIGGFDYALDEVGGKPTIQAELDKNRRKILAQHWPTTPRGTDVTDLTGSDLAGAELITAGFPCGDTSIAAPHRRGLDGDRSRYFWEFARLLDEARPRWFIVENPTGFIKSRGGRDFSAAIDHLVQLRYSLAFRVVDSASLGSAQRRPRVLIVGHLGPDPRPAALVLGDPEGGGADPRLDHARRRTTSRLTLVGDPAEGERLTFRKSRRPRSNVDYATYVEDTQSNTLTGFDSGFGIRQTHLVLDHGRPRVLTIQEWERLQGFPDDWTAAAPMSTRFKALGDAMNVHMARWVAQRLVAVHNALPILQPA